jgi:hypothetical protein
MDGGAGNDEIQEKISKASGIIPPHFLYYEFGALPLFFVPSKFVSKQQNIFMVEAGDANASQKWAYQGTGRTAKSSNK